ncbi:MAG: fumarylacetoacetate hydrolase [Gammaproteobacteria bacterium HGW-Gammaproteobacteria-8]|nr:MAG: fumarylacetoacetate hydrolase [Gammaproteobacteria bacterium HGW-Gammaproteobacteria-8]
MSRSDPVIAWAPPALRLVDGSAFPARHVWCIGRNYAEHAREMGADPTRETPLFFTKPATALVQRELIDYPADTGELHHEIELVVLLGQGGRDLSPAQAQACVFGYAVGCDLTRRDVQAQAKAEGKPWTMAKGFDQSAPICAVVSATDWAPEAGMQIELSVNGAGRQRATLGEMIWPVPELIAQLSREVTLYPGDVIFTGTPAGVGALERGDSVEGRIEGLPELRFQVR